MNEWRRDNVWINYPWGWLHSTLSQQRIRKPIRTVASVTEGPSGDKRVEKCPLEAPFVLEIDRIIIGGRELKWHTTWTLPRGDKNQKTIFQLDFVHKGKFNLYLASGFVGSPSTVFLELCFLLSSPSPAYPIQNMWFCTLCNIKDQSEQMWSFSVVMSLPPEPQHGVYLRMFSENVSQFN